MSRYLVLCISNFQSRKPIKQVGWLWKYEFGEKTKSSKNFKTPFPHGFSTNLLHKTEFLNIGFCSIFFKFWHSVSFVKDYSVFVGRHTILKYFLVKIYVHFIHLGCNAVLKTMPNIKITTQKVESEHTRVCVLPIQDWKYDMQKMF